MDKTKVMAYFSAFGDELPLEVVTDVLGIQPTKTYKKGDIGSSNNPKPVSSQTRRRKESDWNLSTGYQGVI